MLKSYVNLEVFPLTVSCLVKLLCLLCQSYHLILSFDSNLPHECIYTFQLQFFPIGSSGLYSHHVTIYEMWQHGTKKYFLDVTAVDPVTGDSVMLRGSFRVFGRQEKYFCSLNMINIGMSPIPQGRSLEFISVGKAKKFRCRIDNGIMEPCKFVFFAVIRCNENIN